LQREQVTDIRAQRTPILRDLPFPECFSLQHHIELCGWHECREVLRCFAALRRCVAFRVDGLFVHYIVMSHW